MTWCATSWSPVPDAVRKLPMCWSPALRLALSTLAFATGRVLAAGAGAASTDDLTSLSLEQLLEVKIVGASKYEQKQTDVAASVSVITRQEIKAFGWRTLDEALASLPGVYTTYDRRSVYLGTRGFGLPGDFNTRVLVTIDGNRVNDPIYDSGPFGRTFPVDLDLIERIEFIPGPGGAVYGQNAMLGVVNIITRQGTDVGGAEAALGYQSLQGLGEARATFGKAYGNGVDLLLSLSGMRARGQNLFFDYPGYEGHGVSGVAAGMDGERDRQQLARIARGPWSLEYVSDWDRKDDPTAAFLSTPLVPGQSEATSVDLTQLKYQDQFAGDSLQVSARLFNGRFVSLEKLDFFGSFYETRGVSQWHGVELRLVETALAGHTLMLGFEGQQTPMLDQGGKGLVFSASNFFIQSPGYRVGVYAQDEWRIAERWSATVGLRVDRNNITDDKASPRAGLIWQATPATTIKALYGRAYRAPNAYERDYQDGHSQVANPELTSERIDTEELAADQRVGRDLALRASVYRWSMRNLINLGIDPANGIPQQQQVGGKVKARGLELSADKTWDNGARLRGSVALQYAAYISGAPLLNSPKMLDKLNLSAPLPLAGLRAGYELSYDSQRLSRDGTPLGGYTLSNLTLETESLAKGLEVSLSVFNLFDKRYQQTADDTNYQNAFVQDGRSVRLALRQRF